MPSRDIFIQVTHDLSDSFIALLQLHEAEDIGIDLLERRTDFCPLVLVG